VNKITITTIISIVSVVMPGIGLGIVFIPPMVVEYLIWYSPDNETVIEEAMDSPLMMSTLPTLSSPLLLILSKGARIRLLLVEILLYSTSTGVMVSPP
jgi:hypothetical protein